MGKENGVRAHLYTDKSKESETAREILTVNNISFAEAKSPEDYTPARDFKPPVVHSREGEFVGVERIKSFARLASNGSKPEK